MQKNKVEQNEESSSVGFTLVAGVNFEELTSKLDSVIDKIQIDNMITDMKFLDWPQDRNNPRYYLARVDYCSKNEYMPKIGLENEQSFQKQNESGYLRLVVVKDGKQLKDESTYAEYGSISLAGNCD
jgi:hypothetical protein